MNARYSQTARDRSGEWWPDGVKCDSNYNMVCVGTYNGHYAFTIVWIAACLKVLASLPCKPTVTFACCRWSKAASS